jgi:hypothetical protein
LLGHGGFPTAGRRTEHCSHLRSNAEPAVEIPDQNDAARVDRFMRELDDLIGHAILVCEGLHEFEQRRS